VTDLVFAAERGDPVDSAKFDAVIGAAVDDVVGRQIASGIDLVSDGEMSKISYATYIKDRITGFDGDSPRTPPADLEDFPGFLERQASSGARRAIAGRAVSGRSRPRRWHRWRPICAICDQQWNGTCRSAGS